MSSIPLQLPLCVSCKHYQQHRCKRHCYTVMAPTTGVTKTFGSVDAMIERRSYNAYRCGHEGKYWEGK